MTEENSKINFKFNSILFSYLCIGFIVSLLFEPENEEKVPWDIFYESFPAIAVIVALLMGFVLLIWGAKLLELFWNRFISNLFEIRVIDFQEALSIVLVFTIIVASL